MAIMRATDVFYAFPSVLLAVAISGALGTGIFNAILALTIVFIPQMIPRGGGGHHGGAQPGLCGGGAGQRSGRADHRAGPCAANVLGPVFVYATSLISVSMILASACRSWGSAPGRPMRSGG